MIKKVKRLLRQVTGLVPTRIPTGVEAFNNWVDSIRSTYDLPTEDSDSIRFAIATMIMHLGPTTAYKPKFYFVLALRAAGAKQVASGIFQEVKLSQKAKQEAAARAVVSNDVSQS